MMTPVGVGLFPVKPSQSAAVDWANVPPMRIIPPTTPQTVLPLGIVARNMDTGAGRRFIGFFADVLGMPVHPTGGIGFESSGIAIEAGSGSSAPAKVAIFASGNVEFLKDVWFSNNARTIKFTGATYWDTILKAGATAGLLTINGAAIQVAVTQADGTEFGLAEARDQIAELRAELASLREQLNPKEA